MTQKQKQKLTPGTKIVAWRDHHPTNAIIEDRDGVLYARACDPGRKVAIRLDQVEDRIEVVEEHEVPQAV